VQIIITIKKSGFDMKRLWKRVSLKTPADPATDPHSMFKSLLCMTKRMQEGVAFIYF
jgi:hypothetical protein